MWTNVFKLPGFNLLSWFQYLPHESELIQLPDKSVKDVATQMVLSSHLQLQKEGLLSTWTNSFVGPWDPSQGFYNPDEKIKLWLFLPGRYSTVTDSAQVAVSKLKVVASGVWVSPGDSEEVATALSQALRNRIERVLSGFAYMRFGDVFSKFHPSENEEFLRRGQPTIEFIVAATEEGIFVHALVSAKHVRALSSGDMERVLKHSSKNSGYRLPVIASPHGICGRLTGCCPSDLVKQMYFSSSKSKTSNGFIGLPSHVSQGSGCQLRGQSCYVEVTLGCPRPGSDKALQSNSHSFRNPVKHQLAESPALGRGDQKGSLNNSTVYEKTFVYPAEAVLVPALQYVRSSLKRFWLQNWIGPSMPGSSFFMLCSSDSINSMEEWNETNGICTQRGYNSSSNSNCSSISSISSSSSETDYRMATGASELEADADSLSCRQSGLSFKDRLENDFKLGSKRPRSGMMDSFAQVGTSTSASFQDTYKSDYGSVEVNNSAITGFANEQIGSHWDWDGYNSDNGTDIHSLLDEFGGFGDFFENDALPFGEPPGTAESQTLMLSAPDCGDVVDNPVGPMDISDQILLSESFASFESLIPPPAVAMEEIHGKNQGFGNGALTSGPMNCSSASNVSEFDHIIKAEALMTFTPEYGAVETPASEVSSSIFRSPYLPESRKVESSSSSANNYIYGATPPSPCLDVCDEKTGMPMNLKACPGKKDANNILRSKNYYVQVGSGKEQQDRRLFTSSKDTMLTHDGVAPSPFPTLNSTDAIKASQRKMIGGTCDAENSFLSMSTIPATEIECIIFQASMCRIRHTLLSSSSLSSLGRLPGDPSMMPDNISGKYELKRKDSIPIRIAGDIDGGIIDGHLNAPVGVWRSVGAPRVSKPSSSSSMEISTSLPHTSFSEEGMLSYGQRQPLQELLDGITLIVQQATAFVDLALDSDCGDGPYGWLALQEQWRKGFSCGPSMIHAGCGGTLASCHSLDIAGVELTDPLSADVHASSVISLLQSDIKMALKSAFGVSDGPLSITDWCKGRNQSGETTVDGFSAESTISDCRDSSSTVALSAGEPLSPSPSVGSAGLKDVGKVDETSQRRSNQENCSSESDLQISSRLRPTLLVAPLPAILVGYQDDWLKTSASSLHLWEKAPLEPYALQKPITYCVICPDIDPLTSAAADFFQQLGSVYETCKLGTHLPQSLENQMEVDSGKLSSAGFVLLDCPQAMKIESSNASLVGSISDYFLSLSNGWDLPSYLKSLSKALKALKLGQCLSTSAKEGSSSPSMVIYVVCPFPEPFAVLQTVIQSCVAIGSVVFQSDRERRSMLHSQVSKALSYSAAVDEASISNVLVLSGFSVPRLVLQIVTVDAIFKVTSPSMNELVILKETAFTIYNKARRISRGSSNETVQSSSSNRSHSVLTQISSPTPGLWKDCVGPRITGHSLPREGETWDGSWQTRTGAVSCEPSRIGDMFLHDETRYMFEPFFILAEPGSVERGISPLASNNYPSESKPLSDESGGVFMPTASGDTGMGSQADVSELDKTPSLHCCYGWTEDWRWLICIWTDSRGELLDSHIFPFGGISSRQDTKGLECLFVQVLQQGCQILQVCSSDTGMTKPRDFVIARIGSFYELEYQEWQKAINSVGGSEVKKWHLQLRRSVSDGMSASSNGPSLQQQEMSLIQERNLPSSPGPMYGSPHSKMSGYMKGGLGQPSARKQLMGAHTLIDNSRSLLQWVQSISFITIAIDHSLQLVCQADILSPGAQGSFGVGSSGYLEGFTPVKSLGSTPASYILIPSPSMRFLPPTPLQLPTCLTAVSPPLAHLLHSKGSAIPLSTCFVVSKAVPTMRKDYRSNLKEEWPSTLLVSLIDHYGGNNFSQEKIMRGNAKQVGRSPSSEAREFETEAHAILESVAAELHALSWMTVSPAYLERRTALPLHCDMVLRLRRLLHFADKELSKHPEKAQSVG
ncbi:mediator of RNA polymerase II transcription subunit 13 isoform X3 [Argentina anserina]|uniref:mediator of RNA polymerase II transcription subunit 13 isoform X3 n=1 Tax=Argentina anserina TaxID=57926 RepID=UPI00217656F6|nr:mediator of RNA polymerase II transcription subunit 13 isoform X3 [Potentilla anserina]